MIRKLRQRFIAIAMASLLGTMAILCAAIGIADYCMVSQRVDNAIELLYQNDGSFPDADASADLSEHNGLQITAERRSRRGILSSSWTAAALSSR